MPRRERDPEVFLRRRRFEFQSRCACQWVYALCVKISLCRPCLSKGQDTPSFTPPNRRQLDIPKKRDESNEISCSCHLSKQNTPGKAQFVFVLSVLVHPRTLMTFLFPFPPIAPGPPAAASAEAALIPALIVSMRTPLGSAGE